MRAPTYGSSMLAQTEAEVVNAPRRSERWVEAPHVDECLSIDDVDAGRNRIDRVRLRLFRGTAPRGADERKRFHIVRTKRHRSEDAAEAPRSIGERRTAS